MEHPRIEFDAIRIQTARMMEIYALLRGELEKNASLNLPDQTRKQLDRAVATIHSNMRQMQESLAVFREENSPETEEACELTEILESFLQWHHKEGE